MAEPPSAKIRPFEEKDLDAVRYFVGSDIMEAIPLANRAIFSTPSGLLAWFLLSFSGAVLTGIYPALPMWDFQTNTLRVGQGLDLIWEMLGSLVSIVPFLASGVILLAIAEIQHRSIFERALERRLRMEDMRDIVGYYGAAPASGFYVLDYDGKVIGCVGVDASRPQDSLNGGEASSMDKSTPSRNLRQRKGGKAVTDNTENVALIRTLAVSAAYRPAGVEEDLLRYALTKSFAGSSPVQKVEIPLRSNIFPEKVKLAEKFGLRRTQGAQVVDSELISIPQDAKVVIFVPSKPLSKVWPLDLGAQSWSIDKTSWKA